MDLIAAMHDAFKKSKFWLTLFMVTTFLLLALTMASIFYDGDKSAKVLALSSVIFQILAFIFKQQSGARYDLGEQVRRLVLLQDGLGKRASNVEISNIAVSLGSTSFVKPPFIGKYYESKLPAGPDRLLEIMQESAFWSGHLAKTCFATFVAVSVIGILGSLIAFISLVFIGVEAYTLGVVARVLVSAMGFFAAGELLDMGLKFNRLDDEALRIVERASHAAKLSPAEKDGEAWVLLNTYNSVLAASPPIPQLIYKFKQKCLNDAWNARNIP